MTDPAGPPVRVSPRASDAHKGTFGKVMLVGGSRGMAGSIALSSMAALHTGSGLVSAAVPDRCLETVASFEPCVMTIPLQDDSEGRFSVVAAKQLAQRLPGVDAVGCGPGMTTGPGSIEIVKQLLRTDGLPLVLDADAINALAQLGWPDASELSDSGSPGPRVLTPHPGELSRLVGVSPKDRPAQIDAAQRLVSQTGAVVVVKGGPTVVVSADQRWTSTTGNPGMASGGTGDVLTGMVTSLLGQGFSAWDAARLAVWLHGAAGDRAADRHGQAGLTAKELIAFIGPATQQAERETQEERYASQ